MKKIIQIATFLFIATICQSTLYAQVREVDPTVTEEPAKSTFASRLWYGGNLILGYSGGNFESLFQVGISPMVGYKVFEGLSIGPRASIIYSAYRLDLGTEVDKSNTVSWAVGVFARYKIIRSIFVHTEAELEDTPIYLFNGSTLEVFRRQRNNFYVGGGYNSSQGGGFGYEIMLLYNLNQPDNDVESPFDIRVGFTYNF